MEIKGSQHIGFSRSNEGEIQFSSFNPLENTALSFAFTEATLNEIEKAAKLAQKAFFEYRMISSKKRALFLKEIARNLENGRETLTKIYTLESGLSNDRANNELNRTIFQLETYAKLLENTEWDIVSKDEFQGAEIRSFTKKLLPLGPVVVFTASNFPFAYSTAGGDTASALAAGCPVIVKGHPFHAGTSELVAECIVQAAKNLSLPNGVFSHVHLVSHELAQQLVLHTNIKAVGFTGSQRGGLTLMQLASTRKEPIPVFAEMGSVNPVVLFPQALKNDAVSIAEKLAFSLTSGSGQFCTNPGIIIALASEELEQFLDHFVRKLEQIEPQCMLHPAIHQQFEEKREEIENHSAVTSVFKKSSEKPNFGTIQVNRVASNDFLLDEVLEQEVFGAHSLLVVCENQEDMFHVLSKLNGQLTCSYFGTKEDEQEFSALIEFLPLKAGRIISNGVPTGVEVCDSMHHGGPFPASSDSRFTAVGKDAIFRFLRPVSFQKHVLTE